jgi:hypothetical protein
MRALRLILSLMIPTLWLSACAPPPGARPALLTQGVDAAARRADIRRQLAPLCPQPLSPADLNAAAALVEKDHAAAPVVELAFRLHLESRVCRGL